MSKHIQLLFIGIASNLSLLLLSGCATMDDPAQARSDHTRQFSMQLDQLAQEQLKESLSLDQCIDMAMTQSYEARQADLKVQLAKLDKDIAFANFLPQVTATAGLTTWSIPQSTMNMQLADKTYSSLSTRATLPLLVPATYFLYQNTKLSQDTSKLAAHLVRQTILLQTTVSYFECLILEDTIAAKTTQLQAAQEQYKRIKGLADEELVAQWEAEQARYLQEATMADLQHAKRALAAAKGSLLKIIGLNPLAKLALKRENLPDPKPPRNTPAENVIVALASHPSLSIADHAIVIHENMVRMAIADFLPNIGAFVNASWTTDSFAKHVHSLYGGFNATMDVFKGFTKVKGYKAARLRKKSAEWERDSLFLSIILEVVKADNAVRDAFKAHEVASLAATTSEAKFDDYHKKQREGLVTVNDMLEAQAARDNAQTALTRANFERHLALAQLQLALGIIEPPNISPKTEN